MLLKRLQYVHTLASQYTQVLHQASCLSVFSQHHDQKQKPQGLNKWTGDEEKKKKKWQILCDVFDIHTWRQS